MQDDLVQLIIEIAKDLNDQEQIRLEGDLDGETRLFGQGGILDSMGLVSLVIAVEQAIEERYGVSVALADEKAMSQKSSPYRTVGTLAAYAVDQSRPEDSE